MTVLLGQNAATMALVNVRICWALPTGAWQRLFDTSPLASPYHSPAWHAAWQADTGEEVACVAFKFGDGSRAAMPVAFERGFRGAPRRARSGVGGGYGGLFGPRPLSARHVNLAYKAMSRRFKDLFVLGFPHQGWDGAPRGSHARTLRVRLAPRETLRQGYSKNRRRSARFAFEYGVDFGPLDGERMDAFLALARACGRSPGAAFWRALSRRCTDLALNLAWQQGQVAAARIFAWRAGIAYDLAFLVSPRFRNGEAATAVTEGAFIYAHSLGLQEFDLMPSGTREGLYRFKESFGAAPATVREYRQASAWGRAADALRAWRGGMA